MVEPVPHRRLNESLFTFRAWRIHELTADFRLEDVWALPTPGGPGDLPRLVLQIAAGDTSTSASCAVRALFAIRWKVGGLLGWDDPDGGDGAPRSTLRGRLPVDLREAPGPDFATLHFTSLYLIVYPPLIREIGRDWRANAGDPTPAHE